MHEARILLLRLAAASIMFLAGSILFSAKESGLPRSVIVKVSVLAGIGVALLAFYSFSA